MNAETISTDASSLSEWLEFVARLVEATAWPIVVIVFILVFRSRIAAIAGNLRSIKWGDAEATFSEELKLAAESAKGIVAVDEKIADANKDRLAQLMDMIPASPTGAIVAAWKDVSAATTRLTRLLRARHPDPYDPGLSPIAFVGLLTIAEYNTLTELRSLKNKAVQEGDDSVTVKQATEYVRLADKLTDALNEKIKQQEDLNLIR